MQDGAILGIDTDGNVIQWNADNQMAYNCGETIEEFGVRNITPSEKIMLDNSPSM